MICPYCSFKNSASALICNQCGIILRLGKTNRFAPTATTGRLSFVRGLLPGRAKGQLASLQTRIADLAAEIHERAEADLKVPERAPAARLVLGALFLIQDEIEKSVNWFQQAQQIGSADAEFRNNAGVALARRGALPQAMEMLEQAKRLSPAAVPPFANLAHLFLETGAEPDPATSPAALAEIQRALTLEPKNPTLYNRLGLIFSRERRYEEAALQFQQAYALADGNSQAQADAQNNIGLAQFLAGDRAAAANAFVAALQHDPNHAHAQCNQSLTQAQETITTFLLEKLSRAARLEPTGAGVRTNYGFGLCRIGAINDGILELKEAVGFNSRLFEASYNLGKAYADYDVLEVAERYLARALQFSPRSGEALTAMGVVKTQQRMLAQAVQNFQAAVRLWPQIPLARINLGVAQGLAGEFTEALMHLRKAAELSPEDPSIPAQIGWLYLRQDSLNLGVEELGEALRRDPHIPEVQNNFGLCYIAMNKPELSIPHFKRALELKPDFHAVHYQWGLALANQKLADSALKEWELTARYEPANADCHVNRGVLFYQKGQIDEAIAEFRHVIVLRQTRMEDFSNLGLAYAKSGVRLKNESRNPQDPRMKQSLDRHKQAIDMFDRALVIDKRNVMLHSNRGLACFFASRAEDAMREWGLVSQINPAYASRRGKKMQSEFDDTQIALMPFTVADRAVPIPPKTGPYLPRFLAGYDTEEWDLLLNDTALIRLKEMHRDVRRLERDVAAL